MRLTVDAASVPGPSGHHEPLVPPTTFVAEPGEVTLVPSAPGVSVAALALALGGAVRLASGSVDLWGSSDPAVLQEHVVLVDVEGVTAPEDALPVRAVVGEQLALGRQRARRADVTRLLGRHGVTDPAQRWDRLPAATRTALLLDVAAARPRAQVVVLAGPDRHGGRPEDWATAARRVAERVLTVVVICTPESAAAAGSFTAARTVDPPTPAVDPDAAASPIGATS